MADAVGGSYQIEQTCRQQEVAAKQKLAGIKLPARIENYCTWVGQAVGGSYQIKLTCARQELAARDQLK